MKKLIMILTTLALSFLGAGSATAADFYPWNNHAAPFNFPFGNEIDLHQQTRLNSDGTLFGFFYMSFTGVVTKDGYRVATHVDCTNPANVCTVGWILNGKPRNAKFLYQVEDDHPVFLENRPDIPTPGAYVHFHWLNYAGTLPPVGVSVPGYLLQLTAVDVFCFIHHNAGSATSTKTCHDNDGVAVNLGIDSATHLNIVTSYPGY